MEAALAEFRAEDVGMDVEDDIDFIVMKGEHYSFLISHHCSSPLRPSSVDEDDAFESDFESTDEEAQAQEAHDDEERMARDDRQARRVSTYICYAFSY